MSNDILVQVPAKCSRTGKDFNEALVLTEVPAYVAREESKKATAEALTELLSSSDGVPDLVVMWKGQCHVLNTVHTGSDAAVSRYINAILKKDVYDVPEPRARKTPEEAAAAAAEAADKPKGKRGRKPKAAAVEEEAGEPEISVDEEA